MNGLSLPAGLLRPGNRGSRSGVRVENRAGTNTARVFLYDYIGYGGISAQDLVPELSGLQVDHIDLRINSGGGDIFDGFALYNAFRNHPAKVTATVDGLAASAASFIAMAADEVVMEKTGTMMIHDGMSPFCSGNAAALREMANILDKMSDTIAGTYADRSGRAKDDFRALMLAETWFNADEAVAAGLADRIAGQDDPEPDGAPVAAAWDLSIYSFAGRSEAPAPVIPPAQSAAPVAEAVPTPTALVPDLASVIRNAIQEVQR
jgi:ATP-dependent protease ClpP protease subunit